MPFELAFTSACSFRMRARDFANLNSSIFFAVRLRSSSNNAINSDFDATLDELVSDADPDAATLSDSLESSDFLNFFSGGAIVNRRLNSKTVNKETDFAAFMLLQR